MRRVLASLGCCALAGSGLAACGSTRQDADEPAGTYPVDVVHARFPKAQSLAQSATMRIEVRNTGRRAIPQLAVTIDAFTQRDEQPGRADPTEPVWIVDRGPRNGDTAYVGTWALGRVAAGQSRTFVWHVTPVRAGTHTLHWTVAAGLDGRAQARAHGGRVPQGRFTVRVSGAPRAAHVDPETGAVVPGS